MAREIDRSSLMAFVLKRRKVTGGYGATPRLPATIQDTFQALAIRIILGEEPPTPQEEPALAEYLTRMQTVPWIGIGTTFRLLFICRLCGLGSDATLVRARIIASLSGDDSLSAIYYANRIFIELLGYEPDFPGAARAVKLPARCAVDDAARYLFLQSVGGRPSAGAEELAGWLQRAQNGDGGFGFFPGTTSFIENCHAALAALSLLGARPLAPGKARDFLVSCQTGGGGFARSPGAAPFLDASWHGVAALRLLEGMMLPTGLDDEAAPLRRSLLLAL